MRRMRVPLPRDAARRYGAFARRATRAQICLPRRAVAPLPCLPEARARYETSLNTSV